ncbi:tyrosine-type recombinase/integrase [Acanthopleuribacter pedis]|uniref:Tyrosine-type recombinase/integrase n=1 Tax=Acanthopleuribacter pedis TaxID=442870 RepID=A0A8J7U811_9BACT|nr:tyrosine-type recombinase/integrase [Acanthopleuribacter pedis]MBO1321981.1 tyrosine-type recombinase/integrase [Acanthopleuribacter pedis]
MANGETDNESIHQLVSQFLGLQQSVHTKRAYRADLKQFTTHLIKRDLSHDCLLKVSPRELHAESIAFLNRQTKRDPVSGHILNTNTLNRKRYCLASFFQYLHSVYGYPHNPIHGIKAYPKQEASNTPILSAEEIRSLIKTLSERRSEGFSAFRNYLVIATLFHFALRRTELAGLRWDQLHPNPWHFAIRQKGNRLKYVPVFPELMARLNEYRLVAPEGEYLFSPAQNNRTKSLNKPLSTNSILNIVAKISTLYLGGKHITPHSFRASFICHARDLGLDDKTIMNATGQTSTRTLNYYDIRNRLRSNGVLFFRDWFA